MRGPSRRDIGHGNLAERALIPVLPDHEEFPYVIRLVSECMSSNGSTSMASTCGSTLALMDAGVPIKAPVAGAAMGLISEPDGRFVVLTDILGKEDSVGDMDFKVTGTRDGITALQMDIKVQGINEAIIRDGLKQALAARLEILDKMTEVMPEARVRDERLRAAHHHHQDQPREDPRDHRQGWLDDPQDPGRDRTEINVEDDGTVEIAAVSGENSRKAIDWIESLTREVEVGALYLGKVTRIMGFGAFVEILPGKEGLVRIGELADYHVPTVEDVVSVGDEIMVVVIGDRPPGPRQPLPQGRDAAPPGQGSGLGTRRLRAPPIRARASGSSTGRPVRDSGAAAVDRRAPPARRTGRSRWYTPAVPGLTTDPAEPCPR